MGRLSTVQRPEEPEADPARSLSKRIESLGAFARLGAIGPWLGRLVEAGTHGYPPETKRRLMI
jgi:adenylate cyclase